MSQQEIVEWLHEHPGWHSTVTLRRGIGRTSNSCMSKAIKPLVASGEIVMEGEWGSGQRPKFVFGGKI